MKLNNGKFKKGQIPWNKGLKGIHLSPNTEFKKGVNNFDKHPSWKGGVHKLKTGEVYVMIKSKLRVRRPRYIWEQNYGAIPQGYVIYHKDGNTSNDDINNLELITRRELAKRNKIKSL